MSTGANRAAAPALARPGGVGRGRDVHDTVHFTRYVIEEELHKLTAESKPSKFYGDSFNSHL